MKIKDLVLRLRIEDDNKLFDRRNNSSSSLKENVMEQVIRSHNKNQQKFVVKGKIIAKKFNGKRFICRKIEHLANDCKNKGNQGNHTKRLLKLMPPRLITSLMKFQK